MLKILLILFYYLKLLPGDAYPIKDEEVSPRGRTIEVLWMRNHIQLWSGFARWPIDRSRELYPEEVYIHQYVQSLYKNLPKEYQLVTSYVPRIVRYKRHHSFNNSKFIPWKKLRENSEDLFAFNMMLRIYKIRDKHELKKKRRLFIILILIFLYCIADILRSISLNIFLNKYL